MGFTHGIRSVSFGGTAAASFTVDSYSQITAVAPAHGVGSVDVTVLGSGGSATLAGAFTYVAAPVPVGPGLGQVVAALLGAPPFAAKLEVARARVLGAARRLSVLAPISGRASGKVRVRFRAAGRTDSFDAAVDARNRRVVIDRRISLAQARLGTGILTLSYPGDADTQPQVVRLRAASGRADLRASRPKITGDRLRASGTVSSRARGVVRLQVLFEPAGAPTRTIEFTARISGGRYSFDERLPADVVAQIAARRGVVHSYTLFTGYLPARVRGEMSSFQILGQR
jgi:hypothetical protein